MDRPGARQFPSALILQSMLVIIPDAAHPAILSMQKGEGDQALSVREESDRGWVVVHFVGKTKQGSNVKDLPVDLVVVGKAAE